MSGYQVNSQTNIKVKNTLCCNDQPRAPQTIYCSFRREANEIKINPINLQGNGYFLFSPVSTSMNFQFVCSEGYSKVIGVVSFQYPYELSQPSQNVFQVNLPSLPNSDWFGTISLMVE